MLLDRLPSGSPVFSLAWKQFADEWRTTDQRHHAVLDDGRPAVIHDGDPPSYHTVAAALWEHVRPRLAALLATRQHPARHRLCEACGTAMRLTHEWTDVWTFACERCGSVEAWGKDVVGGTIGAGARELGDHAKGAAS